MHHAKTRRRKEKKKEKWRKENVAEALPSSLLLCASAALREIFYRYHSEIRVFFFEFQNKLSQKTMARPRRKRGFRPINVDDLSCNWRLNYLSGLLEINIADSYNQRPEVDFGWYDI